MILEKSVEFVVVEWPAEFPVRGVELDDGNSDAVTIDEYLGLADLDFTDLDRMSGRDGLNE